MEPKPKIDWLLIKVRYEAGESYGAISRSLGGRPTKQAIGQKALRDKWERVNPGETLKRLPVKSSAWELLKPEQQLVIQAFALGARTVEEAAARACVSQSTIQRWKKDDDFGRLCQAARLQARDELVSKVKDFGSREWRPNAWLLERLWKDEFSAAQQVVHGNTFNVLGSINLGIDRGLTIDAEAREIGDAEVLPAT